MRYRLGIVYIFALSFAVLGWRGAARAQGAPAAAAGPAPLATADGEAPGTQVQITKLKRVGGDSGMLQFVIVNNSDTQMDLGGLRAGGGQYRSVDGVYLVDLSGKKKYEAVHDSEKNCVCSRDLQSVGPKSSINLWVKFPAPPDNVQKVGVVVPHFMPMDDVPLASQ